MTSYWQRDATIVSRLSPSTFQLPKLASAEHKKSSRSRCDFCQTCCGSQVQTLIRESLWFSSWLLLHNFVNDFSWFFACFFVGKCFGTTALSELGGHLNDSELVLDCDISEFPCMRMAILRSSGCPMVPFVWSLRLYLCIPLLPWRMVVSIAWPPWRATSRRVASANRRSSSLAMVLWWSSKSNLMVFVRIKTIKSDYILKGNWLFGNPNLPRSSRNDWMLGTDCRLCCRNKLAHE